MRERKRERGRERKRKRERERERKRIFCLSNLQNCENENEKVMREKERVMIERINNNINNNSLNTYSFLIQTLSISFTK